MVFTVALQAATARPLLQAALPVVLLTPGPLLPPAQQGTMLALSAAASIACWLTSVSDGLLPYDMLAETMLNFTLSVAQRCQASASVDSEELQEPAASQIE